MQIPDKRLEEFIRLYEEEFGEAITLDQAREMATRVLELLFLLAQALPEEKQDGTMQPRDRC